MRILVRVPASTSNLGPGFDCLGLALGLHLEVEVETAGRGLHISAEGEHASRIPLGPENLVHACLARVLRRARRRAGGLRLHIRNAIPIGRGLGSSGAATLAGLVAGRLLAGELPLEPQSLLHEAVQLEGHPDNVAPALLGGFVASALDGDRVHTVRLPWPAELELLVVLPELDVPTDRARSLLPRTVPLADAVYDLSRLALLIGALTGGQFDLLRPGLQDRLHQGRRLQLVPGLGAALDELDAEPGCDGAALSGSGPTLVALVRGSASATGAAAVATLARHGIPARVRRLRPCPDGASWVLAE